MDMKAWHMRDEWALTWGDGKVSARPATPHRETASIGEIQEKVGNMCGECMYMLHSKS